MKFVINPWEREDTFSFEIVRDNGERIANSGLYYSKEEIEKDIRHIIEDLYIGATLDNIAKDLGALPEEELYERFIEDRTKEKV